MSAFICTPEHIALLALALGREKVIQEEAGSVEAAAVRLFDENVRSVRYRYPREAHLPGPLMKIDDQPAALMAFVGHYRREGVVVDDAGLLNMVRCYEYQSCEHPSWDGCLVEKDIAHLGAILAARIVASGRDVAQARDAATVMWEFTADSQSIPPVVDVLYEQFREAA